MATQLSAVRWESDAAAWRRLGFTVDEGAVSLANGAIGCVDGPTLEVTPPPRRPDVDGVTVASGVPCVGRAHPNGARELDHIVLVTRSLEQTSAAVDAALGLPQRRVREVGEGDRQIRQAFHRFGPADDGTKGCIIEIVESARVEGPAALFGVVVIVDDLDGLCAELGPDLIGAPKPAVQSGRSIATVRHTVGLGLPVALMTPA